jgi:SOS-response transcriptional repressor LexA
MASKNVTEDLDFGSRVTRLQERYGLSDPEMGTALGVTGKYVYLLKTGRKKVKDDATIARLLALYEEEGLPRNLQPNQEMVLADSPRAAIKAAMQKKGIGYPQLAMGTKYNAGVLQAVIEGHGSASERMLHAIGKFLDLDMEVLMAGIDEPLSRDHVIGSFGAKPNIETGPGVGRPRFVPLISMAQAGTMSRTAFTDGNYQHEGALAFDVTDNSAIAVRIVGDSMAPQYGEGDLAVVYPSLAPRNNDLVISKLRDEAGGDVFFKIFSTRDSGRRVVLTSYNPAYPPVDYARDEFEWLYPVVAVTKLLRR